jgi:Tfp pilus assembly protein PilO
MKSPKSTNRLLLVAISASVVVCLLLVGAGWFIVLKMSGQVSTLSTEALNLQHESNKLSELSINFQKVLPMKSLVYSAIPTTKDESTFMADLEAAAKANGLTIVNSTIGDQQTRSAKVGDFSQTINMQEYYELPIHYQVDGQYSNFVKFISDLSTLRRLNSVNDISVVADVSDKKATDKVSITFTVTIYAKR